MNFLTKLSFGILALILLNISPLPFNGFSSSALAQSSSILELVNQGKKERLIGESESGYLMPFDEDVSTEIRRAMLETNIKRKEIYSKFAADNNIDVAEFAAKAGKRTVLKALSGEMVYIPPVIGNYKSIPKPPLRDGANELERLLWLGEPSYTTVGEEIKSGYWRSVP